MVGGDEEQLEDEGCEGWWLRWVFGDVHKKGREREPWTVGGLHCCYDETQCRVKEGFNGNVRKLYLKYTMEWVEWNLRILPFNIYILDVTDTGDRPSGSGSVNVPNRCNVCKFG